MRSNLTPVLGAVLGAVTLAGIAAAEPAASPKDVYGTWTVQSGTALVEIADCGDGTPCGTVVWLDAAALPEGVTPETAKDENNPDPERQADPVLGMTLLSGFDEKRNDWRGGRIYDAETGKAYASRLKRTDDGTLQVKGCIGPICQTQVWTPAPSAGGA